LVAYVRASIDTHTLRAADGILAALEEIVEEKDSIGEVDAGIPTRVEQLSVGRIVQSAVTAGEDGSVASEEVSEEPDGIGYVDRSVLVDVARQLKAA